jgi:hypothetical protein
LAASSTRDDPGRVLRDEVRQGRLTREEHVLGAGAEEVGQRGQEPGREAARHQQRGHAPAALALALHAVSQAHDGHDRQRRQNTDPSPGH